MLLSDLPRPPKHRSHETTMRASRRRETGPHIGVEDMLGCVATDTGALAHKVRRLAHLDIPGAGQVTVAGHHAYVGHIPNKDRLGTTIIDISDPCNPRVVATITLDDPDSHSHKVRVVGDIMIVNHERNMTPHRAARRAAAAAARGACRAAGARPTRRRDRARDGRRRGRSARARGGRSEAYQQRRLQGLRRRRSAPSRS